MAIGDLATASSDTTGTSLTYAHSVAGSLTCLWVCTDSFRNPTSSDPTGITYAGAALTKLSNYLGGGGNDNAITLWRRIAPTTGANNVVVTHSQSHDITAMSISYSGVDQTTPNDTVSPNDVATDNPSQVVSSATGDQVVSFVCGWNAVPDTAVATGDLTLRLQNMNSVGVNSMAVGDAPGAASVTCSWTINWNGATDGHGEMNFNVNADAGGGGAATPARRLPLLGVG